MSHHLKTNKKPLASLISGIGTISLALALVPQETWADTVNTSGAWQTGQVQTLVTNINGPAGAQQTSFTGYTAGPYNYMLYSFFVGTSGNYSATSSTPVALNTTWLLRGLFSPSNTAPATPLSAYVVAVLGSGSTPHNSPFTNLALTAGQQYTFLLAYNTGSLAGEVSTLSISGPGCINFGTVDMCSRYVVSSNTVTSNNVALNAARVIDANQNLLNLFNSLNGNQVAISQATTQTLPLLTGGSTAAVRSTMNGMGNIVQARIGFLSGRASGDSFVGDKHVWLKPFASRADQDNSNEIAGYKAETYGLIGGIDGELSPNLRAGGAFAYAASRVGSESASAPQSNDIDIYQLIGYGSYTLNDRSAINFQVDVGQNKNKGNRQIPFAAVSAASNYNSETAHAGTSLERSYALSEATTVIPSVRLDYTWIKDSAYSETGAGLLNLNVASQSTEALVIGVDGKLTHRLSDQTTLLANLGLGYDTINKPDAITAAFAGAPGSSFVTYGISPSPWISRGGFGLVYKLKKGLEITGRYDLEYRESFLNQTASAKMRWSF